MILTNRLFEPNLPGRDAKSNYMLCEGRRRVYLQLVTLMFKAG